MWPLISSGKFLGAASFQAASSVAFSVSILPDFSATPKIGLCERSQPAAPASGDTGPLHMVCVASIVPRKGHDTLFDALVQLAHLDWRLTCVGSFERDTEYAAKLMARCNLPPLSDRVALVGELAGTALDEAYDRADLFVLPTHYEGYGMVVAEALARAIPVVSTRTGAIAELVGDAAGVLVPPGDAGALAQVIATLITDRDQLDRLRRGAESRRTSLPTWQSAAESMEKALVRLTGE